MLLGGTRSSDRTLAEHDADDFIYDPNLLLIERSIDVVERERRSIIGRQPRGARMTGKV